MRGKCGLAFYGCCVRRVRSPGRARSRFVCTPFSNRSGYEMTPTTVATTAATVATTTTTTTPAREYPSAPPREFDITRVRLYLRTQLDRRARAPLDVSRSAARYSRHTEWSENRWSRCRHRRHRQFLRVFIKGEGGFFYTELLEFSILPLKVI